VAVVGQGPVAIRSTRRNQCADANGPALVFVNPAEHDSDRLFCLLCRDRPDGIEDLRVECRLACLAVRRSGVSCRTRHAMGSGRHWRQGLGVSYNRLTEGTRRAQEVHQAALARFLTGPPCLLLQAHRYVMSPAVLSFSGSRREQQPTGMPGRLTKPT
jgi:hypothetical protein